MFERLQSEESRASDPAGEGGQITILVVFGALALVLLFAFIYNTAKQTSRKIEMQGAADSAAVAEGVWMARGMNLTALNNNTMVEVLSIMVSVRAILQTKQIVASALAELALSPLPVLEEAAAAEVVCAWDAVGTWQEVDEALNAPGALGWEVLTALDSFNGMIKRAFPGIAHFQAIYFAGQNGADSMPTPAWVFPAESSELGMAVFPLARGPRDLLVQRAQDCTLPWISPLRAAAMAAAAAFPPCGPLSIFLSALFINLRIDRNLEGLLGVYYINEGSQIEITGFGDIAMDIVKNVLHVPLGPLGGILGFVGDLVSGPLIVWMTPSLRWEADVRPMILTDSPDSPETENEHPSLVKVHHYLQYLAVAGGRSQRGSPIGGEKFANPAPFPRLTYAQAQVYNPTSWDMFTQDWRAKLVRARLLDEKWQKIQEMLGLSADNQQGWSFVNTH
jgi:hypothetical protein